MISRIALSLCVILVGLLTAGAMAVRSASRIWLRHWAERRLHSSAVVNMYLERPHQLLAAANVGVALTIGIAGVFLGWRSADDQDIAVLALGGYAAVIVIVGQLIPRAIARRWPSFVIPITMPVLRGAQALTAPLLWWGRPREVVRTDAQVDAAMGDLLREGELEGVGKRDEIAIISGVVEFGEKHVGRVMTPRAELFAIPDTLDARQAAIQIAESKFSRVPVYKGSIDNIVGMYHAFDIIKEGGEHQPALRPVTTTPADAKCNELLFRMLGKRVHLAVVQGGEKQTLGIVTLENLLEELVGDIRDEHDELTHAPTRT
jgi:putative hemolysin